MRSTALHQRPRAALHVDNAAKAAMRSAGPLAASSRVHYRVRRCAGARTAVRVRRVFARRTDRIWTGGGTIKTASIIVSSIIV